MAKKYDGNKPAATPKMGEFENFIADEFGQATMNCLRKGEEMGLQKGQIQQIMLFSLRQLGKQASSIIAIMSASMARTAKDRIEQGRKKVPVDPLTLKPKA